MQLFLALVWLGSELGLGSSMVQTGYEFRGCEAAACGPKVILLLHMGP